VGHSLVRAGDTVIPGGAIDWSPDGTAVAVFDSATNTTVIWDVSDPYAPRRVSALPHAAGNRRSTSERDAPHRSIAWSPDGKMIATDHGGDHLALWDVSRRSSPRLLSDSVTITSESGAFAVGWLPNGHAVLALAGDEGVRVVDVTDPVKPRPLPRQASAIYSIYLVSWPTGGTILALAAREVSLWDFSRPDAARRLGNISKEGIVDNVSWLGDGLLAVSGSRGVALWDVERPDTPRQLGQYSLESVLKYSSESSILADDRTMLVTGPVDDETYAADHLAVFLDLGEIVDVQKDPVERACAMLGRGLTREEWEANVPGRPYEQICGT
jgi:WD40 repeat protein